jgi:predicted amino acid racemase
MCTVGAIEMSDYIQLNKSNSNHKVAELNRTSITTVASVQLIRKEHSFKLQVSGRQKRGENSTAE